MGRKSFIFTMDAILALIPLFIIISVVSQMSGSGIIATQVQTKALHHTAEGVMEVAEKTGVLDEIGIIYSNYTLLQSEGDPSWVNERNRLISVIKRDLDPLIPEHMGYAIYIEGEEVYSSDSTVSTRPNKTEATTASSASRITTGYHKGAPSRGCMSRATLIKIAGKRTSDYAYFGGFIGQGDITVQIRDIPSDAKPKEIQLELMTPENFDFYINDNYCDTIISAGENAITSWSTTSSSCLDSIVGGETNNFTLRFAGSDLTKKYVAGGYIRVIYDTSLLKKKEGNIIRYYFPGVGDSSEGLINIYDGFYVPGTVTSINAKLHFFNNYTTFLNIAGENIAEINGSEYEQNVILSNSNFSVLNYNNISLVTFPIRLGSKITQIPVGNGTADVILITDVSGSMRWRIGYSDTTPGVVRPCCPDGGYRAECMEDPTNPLFQPDTQRLALAKCLDKYFVDIILNTTGNRVGLVHFSTNAYDSTGVGLTSDNTTLFTAIDSYTAYGGTCICCAINKAYEILNSQSNENRTKFIIVMTDGITGFTCDYSGWCPTWWGYPVCGWFCSCGCTGTKTQGAYVCGGNPSDCGTFGASGSGCDATGCSGTSCGKAMNNANWSAWRAHTYLNATIYSVGFGDLATCCAANWTLTAIAQSGNGSVYISSNASELAEIYREIAREVVNLSYVAQVAAPTPGIIPSYLYPDSYIEFEYEPEERGWPYGTVEITTQTDAFSTCSLNVFIPGEFQVTDFEVTSYSGAYWTDNVSIMNDATGGWSNVYYLEDFGTDYILLGDPYIVDIPASLINSNDTNYVDVRTGLSGSPSSQCLNGSRIIYTFRFRAPVPYSEIRERCTPKNISVYYDIDYDGTADGCVCVSTDVDITPPSSCASPYCTPVENLNPEDDSIDDAFLRIMDNLNFYDDKNPGGYGDNSLLYDGTTSNPIDIKISPEIVVESTSMLGIPKLYEPVEIRLEVWG